MNLTQKLAGIGCVLFLGVTVISPTVVLFPMAKLFIAAYDAIIGPFAGPFLTKAISAKEDSGKRLAGMINLAQAGYYLEQQKFSPSIGALGLGDIEADDSYYRVALLPQPDPSESVTIAQAKRKELRSYIAVMKVVDLKKVKEGFHGGFEGIMCVTDRPSMSPPNLPRYSKESHSFECASGSKSL